MGNKTQEVQKLYENLKQKLETEYNNFLDDLLKQDKQDIIKSSYKKVFLEDIKLALLTPYEDYDKEELQNLLNKENILEDIYEDWSRLDISYMDRIRDCVYDYMIELENENEMEI